MHLLHPYRDWALLALRLTIGVVFVYHGYQKWMFWTAVPESMPANMVMLFKILAIVEPLAGLALILGVVTEWAAIVLAIIMIGAIYVKITAMGVPFASSRGTGWEFDLSLLAGSLVLMTVGPGMFAMMRGK